MGYFIYSPWVGVWRFAIALLLVGLAVRAHADIEESKDWLITERDRNFFARISSESGFPIPPLTKGVLVYGRQTGGTFDLLAVGGENIDARMLAMAVDEWRAASSLDGTVHYSTERDGSAARFKFQANRLFASEARTFIPVRSLIDRLRQLDSDVAPVWYCPPFVETIGHEGTIRRTPKELITVFDFRRRSPEEFEVISRVDSTPYWWLAGMTLLLPIFSTVGLILGSRQASRPDLDIEERKARLAKIFFSALSLGFVIHVTLFGVTYLSDFTREWADVWFGGSRDMSFAVLLMFVGCLGTIPSTVKTIRLDDRLSATQVDPAALARAEEIGKALNRGIRPWYILGILLGTGLIAVSVAVGSKSDFQLALRMVGMAIVCFTPVAAIKWTTRTLPLPIDADQATLRLSNEAAAAVGATPLPVRIVGEPMGKISITILEKKHFFITRGFELDLTEAEKKFLFAQQYAFAWQPRKVNPWLVAMILVFVGSIMAMVAIGPSPKLSAATAATMIFLFIPGVLNRRRQDLPRLLAADREALDALRDPTAAMAALGKLQSGSQEAFEANFKTVWSNNTLRQRTAGIRARAKELGLL